MLSKNLSLDPVALVDTPRWKEGQSLLGGSIKLQPRPRSAARTAETAEIEPSGSDRTYAPPLRWASCHF